MCVCVRVRARVRVWVCAHRRLLDGGGVGHRRRYGRAEAEAGALERFRLLLLAAVLVRIHHLSAVTVCTLLVRKLPPQYTRA